VRTVRSLYIQSKKDSDDMWHRQKQNLIDMASETITIANQEIDTRRQKEKDHVKFDVKLNRLHDTLEHQRAEAAVRAEEEARAAAIRQAEEERRREEEELQWRADQDERKKLVAEYHKQRAEEKAYFAEQQRKREMEEEEEKAYQGEYNADRVQFRQRQLVLKEEMREREVEEQKRAEELQTLRLDALRALVTR
jgi:hypothetical protein